MSAAYGGVVAARVRTDGVAFVSGTVCVEGEDFVGRDWIDQRTIVKSLDDFVFWLAAERRT